MRQQRGKGETVGKWCLAAIACRDQQPQWLATAAGIEQRLVSVSSNKWQEQATSHDGEGEQLAMA